MTQEQWEKCEQLCAETYKALECYENYLRELRRVEKHELDELFLTCKTNPTEQNLSTLLDSEDIINDISDLIRTINKLDIRLFI